LGKGREFEKGSVNAIYLEKDTYGRICSNVTIKGSLHNEESHWNKQ